MAGISNITLEDVKGMLYVIVQVIHQAQSKVANHHDPDSRASKFKRCQANLKAQTVKKKPHQFTELNMPLSHAFRRMETLGLLAPLDPIPVPNPLPRWFRENEYCDFHQSKGHYTNHCVRLKHEIQDLIDRGAVTFPKPTTNPSVLQRPSMNPFLATINPFSQAQTTFQNPTTGIKDIHESTVKRAMVDMSPQQPPRSTTVRCQLDNFYVPLDQVFYSLKAMVS